MEEIRCSEPFEHVFEGLYSVHDPESRVVSPSGIMAAWL
jgi:hypothetical protein